MTRLGILGAVLAVLWLWPAPAPAGAAADADGIRLATSGSKTWVTDKRATIATPWQGACRRGTARAGGLGRAAGPAMMAGHIAAGGGRATARALGRRDGPAKTSGQGGRSPPCSGSSTT